MQKSKKKKKKKKKKKFYATCFLAFLLFPVIKRAEKGSGFVFFRKVRGKMGNIFLKKENVFLL